MRPVSLLALLLILLGACATPASDQAPPARGPQPNIILLLVDDMDLSLLPYMPRLRQLIGDEGASFSNFFVNDPTCCPSRASILRGQYAHNTGVFANEGLVGGFPAFLRGGMEESTVATWLQAVGYETILIGKYLNGYPQSSDPAHVPPGWSDWLGLFTRDGATSQAQGDGDEGAVPDAATDPYFSYSLNQNGQLVRYGPGADAYQTDTFTRLATARIQAAALARRPFFLYLAPSAPHAPATPAPRHQASFADLQLPRPPSFNEPDMSDKPLLMQRFPPLTAAEIQQAEAEYRRRAQSLQAIDEMVSALVDVLERSNELDRTYFFFTSDNGYHLGQHRFPGSKFTAYEEDIRVPLLVRGPGIPAGLQVGEIALNSDLAPTFAALAGAAAPDFVDGRSLLHLLGLATPPSGPWRQAFLVEYWVSPKARATLLRGGRAEPDAQAEPAVLRRNDRYLVSNQYQALRTTRYLYVEHYKGDVELYDLDADPYELENSATTADPALLRRLAAVLRALAECTGAACWTLEQKGVEP
jgi:N-acetylglucosamine-6-sulfatase